MLSRETESRSRCYFFLNARHNGKYILDDHEGRMLIRTLFFGINLHGGKEREGGRGKGEGGRGGRERAPLPFGTSHALLQHLTLVQTLNQKRKIHLKILFNKLDKITALFIYFLVNR